MVLLLSCCGHFNLIVWGNTSSDIGLDWLREAVFSRQHWLRRHTHIDVAWPFAAVSLLVSCIFFPRGLRLCFSFPFLFHSVSMSCAVSELGLFGLLFLVMFPSFHFQCQAMASIRLAIACHELPRSAASKALFDDIPYRIV
jgi:hypothetical protein